MKANKLFALWFNILVYGVNQEPFNCCLICFFNQNAELTKSIALPVESRDVQLNALQRGLIRLYGPDGANVKDVIIVFVIGSNEACVPINYTDEVKVTVVSIPENPPIKCNRYSQTEQVTSDLTDDEVRNILKSMCNAIEIKQNGTSVHYLPKNAVITKYAEETINFDTQPKSLLCIESIDPNKHVLEYVDFTNHEKKPDHPRLKGFYQNILAQQMPIYPIKSVIALDVIDLFQFMELLQDCIERTPGLETDCIQKALDDYRARIKLAFPGLSDEEVAKHRNHIHLLDCLPSYNELKELFIRISADLPDAPQNDAVPDSEDSEYKMVYQDLALSQIQPDQAREILRKVADEEVIRTSLHLLAAAVSHILTTVAGEAMQKMLRIIRQS